MRWLHCASLLLLLFHSPFVSKHHIVFDDANSCKTVYIERDRNGWLGMTPSQYHTGSGAEDEAAHLPVYLGNI